MNKNDFLQNHWRTKKCATFIFLTSDYSGCKSTFVHFIIFPYSDEQQKPQNIDIRGCTAFHCNLFG